MKKIPKNHPRYHSLSIRERLSEGMRDGLVHKTGLIAHGRGEAFDYLIGEKTIVLADDAAMIAAAALLLAKNPVISVNGNVAALAAKECVSLADSVPAKLEVNLFHRTGQRVNKIICELKKSGAKRVYGKAADVRIPGLGHDRALCDREGIFSADVVLVPLEDGDRCQALKRMGKKVITVDLNPLSRTAKTADVTVVDNVIRAIPNIKQWVQKLKDENEENLQKIVESWDNNRMLKDVLAFISKRLNSLF